MKVNCKNCNEEFDKKPSEIKKTKNNFCTRNCAATYNNKIYPKRHKQPKQLSKYKCIDCGNKITHSREGRCHKCKRLEALRIYGERTIEDVLYKNGDASLKFLYVRKRAQTVLELEERPKICEDCGWDKHVHTAHVKSISSFDLNTQIKIVNASSNLKYLCPNCHWIFDH
jgi:hypothetical protein